MDMLAESVLQELLPEKLRQGHNFIEVFDLAHKHFPEYALPPGRGKVLWRDDEQREHHIRYVKLAGFLEESLKRRGLQTEAITGRWQGYYRIKY